MEIPVHPLVNWAGVLGMLVGIGVIAGVLRRSRREDISHGVLHLFACVIGTFAYVSFLVDRTAVHIDDRSFYVSHYVYWLVSQPLLFVAVALVALPPLEHVREHRLRASLQGGLIGTTVVWISATFFQAWARSAAERWTWFALAVASLLALLWQLWVPVLHQGQIKGGEHLRDYRILAGSLTALSIAYLVVWFLGEAGLKVFSSSVDIPVFLVLDLASDTGLGIVSVLLLERLSKHVDAEPGETSIAASARMSRGA